MNHKLDTDTHVYFYEQEFYVLSNFSAFQLEMYGQTFPTAEHAYHWIKFDATPHRNMQEAILKAKSAHDAFQIARACRDYVRSDWNEIKTRVMRGILSQKAAQHEYVRRKLLETGDRELVEDSWRDDFWGWGPDRNGQNMLGKLWMEVRAELRAGQ